MSELTRGQQVMSVSFNPGQRDDVGTIKLAFANTFDVIAYWADEAVAAAVQKEKETGVSTAGQVSDIRRLEAISKTNLETAQMYAVKAVTR
jgi:hypothetical protein